MNELFLGGAAALWLGVLTSISPCPLATNIAAISYIGRRVDSARSVLLTGLLYTLGRTATYLVLASLLVFAALSASKLSIVLQRHMHVALGPVLILVGMVLLGMIRIRLGGGGVSETMQRRVDAWGMWGAVLLGAVFALSFCPTSAALFFGSLVPLSVKADSAVALPAIYGLGTAAPVLVFAGLIAAGAQYVGKAFNVLAKVEWWARTITGWLFIAIGVYFAVTYIFLA